MKNRILIFCLLLPVFLATSCKFQKLLKSNDAEKKYEMALQLYNEKDYSRALQLFDQLMGVMRATDKAQKIYYCQAYCYFYSKDRIISRGSVPIFHTAGKPKSVHT
jgi:outer membrane protein assembly factor BamD